jgi:RpiB/LacA/LacB family sugar-phosphate isomerase
MRIGIATDHGGFALKEYLVDQLRTAGHAVADFGAHSLTPDDDYPDFVVPLAQAVVAGEVERGLAVCGSGVGASVCANKIRVVRAALFEDHFSARQVVEDDHMEYYGPGRTEARAIARVGSGEGVPGIRIHPGRAASSTPGQSGRTGSEIEEKRR